MEQETTQDINAFFQRVFEDRDRRLVQEEEAARDQQAKEVWMVLWLFSVFSVFLFVAGVLHDLGIY